MLFALMALVLLVAAVVLLKFCSRINQDGPSASNVLTNFHEMHGKGDLSDEEFRTIKTQLADRLRDELKDSDERG